MKTLVFLSILLVLSSAIKWHQLENYTFEDYIEEFQKIYKEGTEEFEIRKAIFEKKLNDILNHNKHAKSTYKKGVNQFTDMTKEELRKKMLGFSAKQYQTVNQQFSGEQYHNATVEQKLKKLPESVDWREKGVITTVKDQGHCGSCWAFASTEQLESYTAINTGHLEVLSVQQLVSCTPNPNQCGGTGGCDGSIAELAFDYVSKVGITTEWKAPYQSYFGVTPSCDEVMRTNTTNAQYLEKNKIWVSGYQKLKPNSYSDLMYHIAFVGPLAVSVEADKWFDYEGGVYDGCNDYGNVTLDHAVQLVGYGVDKEFGAYYLVRNSWDTTFGEKGYIRIKRETTPKCGTDIQPLSGSACKGETQPITVCGQCGILWDTAYPLNATMSGVKDSKNAHKHDFNNNTKTNQQ